MTTKALAPAVQGDRHSPQVITWEKQNLTGATVTAVKQNLSTRAVTAVTGTITVTSSTSEESVFSWAYSEADTGTAGRFVVQFRATYPGDASDATMRASWYVEPLLLATAVAAPLLVGVTAAQAAGLTAANSLSGTNAAATMADIPARYYSSVVDAGGDGDYTTLAAAIAAASAGDAIFIRNGTYAGGVTVNVANLSIIGESMAGVVIQSPDNAVTPGLSITAAGVTLRELKVDGRRDLQTGAPAGDVGAQNYSGIYVTAANFTAERVWVFEPRGMGITGAGGNYGQIRYCRIENRATDGATPVAGAYSYGVLVTGHRRGWQVERNYITGWSQGVGLWFGAHECKVAFNEVVNNYGYLDTAHTTTRSAVEDYGELNTIHGQNTWLGNVIDGSTSNGIECAQGVNGSQFLYNVVRNYNKFGDNTGGAMVIADGGATQRTLNITVSGNRFYGHDVQGSAIGSRGAGVTITGNLFDGFSNSAVQGAIYTDSAISTHMLIANNRFVGCLGGVNMLDGHPGGAVISGNRFVSPAVSTTPLIEVVAGARNVIDGNIMDASGVNCRGITVQATAGDGHRITNNTAANFTSWCIDVRRGYCQVTHNHCVTTNVFGAIQLDGASAIYNNVRWNYCDANNESRTIFLDNSPTYNVIQENTLVGADATVRDGALWPINTNIVTPNHKDNLTVPLTGRSLGAQTIGTTQVTIAHGLPWIPREVRIQMTSDGRIWRSAASDATNIYLTADAADRTAEVWVI